MFKEVLFLSFLLLTGCDIDTRSNTGIECNQSTAQERASFIETCVTNLKAKLITCEELSERLFCNTKPAEPKDNDPK